MKKSILAPFALAVFALAAYADTALYFNGSTYIDLGKAFPLGDSVSLSAWVRISPTMTVNPPYSGSSTKYYGAGIAGQGYWGGTTGFGIFVSSGLTTAATTDDAISTQVRYGDVLNVGMAHKDPTLFTADEWHHVLLVRDRPGGKIYLYPKQ